MKYTRAHFCYHVQWIQKNMSISSGIFQEKLTGCHLKWSGFWKLKLWLAKCLTNQEPVLSTSHRPSGCNSRRGTEPNLNNPSSGLLGWLMRCYTAALTPLSSLFFPITTYTHSGMSVLPKSIAPDITVSITQHVTTAECECTHTWSGEGVMAHSTVRPIVYKPQGP